MTSKLLPAFEDKAGVIRLGGSPLSLESMTAQISTPFFLYNANHVRARLQRMKAAYQEQGLPVSIHYATKANCNPALLRLLATNGAKADVVSLGETNLAINAGFSSASVLFSGVAKTRQELTGALKLRVGQINIESIEELERLAEIAKSSGRTAADPVDLGIRLNPNVCPETHPYITTGLQENKFGLEEPSVLEAVKLIKASPWLRLRGLSLHIGSQLLELSALDEAIGIGHSLQSRIRQQTGWRLDRFDVGGGVGILYSQFDEEQEIAVVDEHARLLKRHLGADLDSGVLAEILTEPGRWLVARCGVLVTEVQYVKRTPQKTFVITDGGMNLLIRPALYEADHRIAPLIRRPSNDPTLNRVDVVGPICESADFLGRDRNLGEIRQDDRIVVFDAGAYGRTMTSLYNQRGWPDEYVYLDGKLEKENVSN